MATMLMFTKKRAKDLTVYVINMIPKFFMECLGCMVFHFIGSVSNTAWGNGICLMSLVYYTAKISGAHLNPAISLTFMLLGHINPIDMLIYWTAQICGCIMGAVWIKWLVPPTLLSGCFVPTVNLNRSEVFGWEALGTFIFLLPIFSVVWYTQNKSGYGNTGPLIIGGSLISTALAVGPFTGAALNPARVLGSPSVLVCTNNEFIPYYLLGEFCGATVVALAIIPWYGINSRAWYGNSLNKAYNKYILPWFMNTPQTPATTSFVVNGTMDSNDSNGGGTDDDKPTVTLNIQQRRKNGGGDDTTTTTSDDDDHHNESPLTTITRFRVPRVSINYKNEDKYPRCSIDMTRSSLDLPVGKSSPTVSPLSKYITNCTNNAKNMSGSGGDNNTNTVAKTSTPQMQPQPQPQQQQRASISIEDSQAFSIQLHSRNNE